MDAVYQRIARHFFNLRVRRTRMTTTLDKYLKIQKEQSRSASALA